MRRRYSFWPTLMLLGLMALASGCDSEEAGKKAAEESAKVTAPPPPGKPPLKDKAGKVSAGNTPHM